MPPILDWIAFDHESASATQDALTIRRDAQVAVHVPEWRRGISAWPTDSPAAYVMTAGPFRRTVTIQAHFHLPPAEEDAGVSYHVRAIDERSLDGNAGCAPALCRLLAGGPPPPEPGRGAPGNPLGAVGAREVAFDPFERGASGPQTFTLAGTRLDRVGIWEIGWLWQWSSDGTTWTTFQRTAHRVYVVAALPTAPWRQAPATPDEAAALPWTEALDVACTWAAGATSPTQAAARVADRLVTIDPALLTYDCDGALPAYVWPAFDLTALLERLRGGFGHGRYVNCFDCAAIVSTLANLLGADLWQQRLQGGAGTGRVRLVGQTTWGSCVGDFAVHEIAWGGAGGVTDPVFDGCLQFDGDADPTAAPETPVTPANLPFGPAGTGSYVDGYTGPDKFPGDVVALPATRQRRALL